MLTLCVPTCAPSLPVLDLSLNSPCSFVLPAEPSPASRAPGLPTGSNITVAWLSGLPFSVTLPETGANFFPPQPSAHTTAKPSSSRNRMSDSADDSSKVWEGFPSGDGRETHEDRQVNVGRNVAHRAVTEEPVDAPRVQTAPAVLAIVGIDLAGTKIIVRLQVDVGDTGVTSPHG